MRKARANQGMLCSEVSYNEGVLEYINNSRLVMSPKTQQTNLKDKSRIV